MAKKWYEEEKERERFYLFPGQGGRAYRRKQKIILQCAIVAGTLIAFGLAALLLWINHNH